MAKSSRTRHQQHQRSSQTLPSSPTHSLSSSSSDFEFTVSISPRKSSAALCPADELFYKGQLLPLQLSPRLSMVRTLLLSSPSSGTASDSSRDSSGSSSDFSSCCDSSRPSSAVDPCDDELKRLHSTANNSSSHHHSQIRTKTTSSNKYFSLPKLSSVFRKDTNSSKSRETSSVKRASASAKEVIRKYLKKVKPLYEKLSTKQPRTGKMTAVSSGMDEAVIGSAKSLGDDVSPSSLAAPGKSRSSRKEFVGGGVFNHSFSGNLRYPMIGSKRGVGAGPCAAASSCPSSMRSSPSHSGVLGRGGGAGYFQGDSVASSMEELQNAIQGAIAHCKNSMIQDQEQERQSGKKKQGQSSNYGLNVI